MVTRTLGEQIECSARIAATKGWKLGHKRIIVLTHIGHNYNSPLMSLQGTAEQGSRTLCGVSNADSDILKFPLVTFLTAAISDLPYFYPL